MPFIYNSYALFIVKKSKTRLSFSKIIKYLQFIMLANNKHLKGTTY